MSEDVHWAALGPSPTHHFAFNEDGVEAILYWWYSESEPGWWLVFADHREQHLSLDGAHPPDWDPAGDEATQEEIIQAVKRIATQAVVEHRCGRT